jgi:hypothetical protein
MKFSIGAQTQRESFRTIAHTRYRVIGEFRGGREGGDKTEAAG